MVNRMEIHYKCVGSPNAKLCESCQKFLTPFKYPQTWISPAFLDGRCINYKDINEDYGEDLKDVFQNFGLVF